MHRFPVLLATQLDETRWNTKMVAELRIIKTFGSRTQCHDNSQPCLVKFVDFALEGKKILYLYFFWSYLVLVSNKTNLETAAKLFITSIQCCSHMYIYVSDRRPA